jgi:biotin-dependent carboxylase-like uncharacterized protein
MSGALVVARAGLSSTLQDRGRTGFVRYGVSMAGAFDPLFYAIANKLVGNGLGEAAIEVTLKGDEYEVDALSCRVAFAGDFAVMIDEKPAEPWRSHTLHAGQRFAVGAAKRGLRGYLSVAGGFDLQPVLGSCSVHTRTGIGPLGGRALAAGQRLPIRGTPAAGPDRRFDTACLPAPRTTLRVVPGPQTHYFAAEDIGRFLASEFEVTRRCDRMGYQLSGPAIDYRKDIALISDGIALGSLQVLEQGVTIVTLVDRQTTGGYPKIATVITPDIRELAHIAPRTKIRFAPITVEDAQLLRRGFDAELPDRLDEYLADVASPIPTTERLLDSNLISGVSNGFDA